MGILCNRGNLMKRREAQELEKRWFKRYREVRQMDLQEGEARDRWVVETERFTDGYCLC